jgi:hypothetical protein
VNRERSTATCSRPGSRSRWRVSCRPSPFRFQSRSFRHSWCTYANSRSRVIRVLLYLRDRDHSRPRRESFCSHRTCSRRAVAPLSDLRRFPPASFPFAASTAVPARRIRRRQSFRSRRFRLTFPAEFEFSRDAFRSESCLFTGHYPGEARFPSVECAQELAKPARYLHQTRPRSKRPLSYAPFAIRDLPLGSAHLPVVMAQQGILALGLPFYAAPCSTNGRSDDLILQRSAD